MHTTVTTINIIEGYAHKRASSATLKKAYVSNIVETTFTRDSVRSQKVFVEGGRNLRNAENAEKSEKIRECRECEESSGSQESQES